MFNDSDLKTRLGKIDGKDYGRYQSLLGQYAFSDLFTLDIYKIPKDPYAPPYTGVYRIFSDRADKRIISFNTVSPVQRVAFQDYIARKFHRACQKIAKGRRGTGYSGVLTVNEPGQAVLDRNNVIIDDDRIEIRCFIGLPARGRLINSALAEEMILDELPAVVEGALLKKNLSRDELHRHIEAVEDAEFLRSSLDSRGLVAFVANGAHLPRESGVSDRPQGRGTIPFISPDSLLHEIDLPHAGRISGMGIKKGVTLIVGGGFHGKSTLLQAFESGCYNHIPGDGRELCVTLSDTVKIQAYSGRPVAGVDISAFIQNLPMGKNTGCFSTENASGSTSQAAGIMEAMEVGAKVLLMDEDTCATNFMVRDEKMQQLVCKNDEPITAFIDNVRGLYTGRGLSTILVSGGVGDYFEVADHIIQMVGYRPAEVTKRAHSIAASSLSRREREGKESSVAVSGRTPLAGSINPENEYGKKRIAAKGLRSLLFGKRSVDMNDIAQIKEISQTKTIGFAILYAKRYMEEGRALSEIADLVMRDVEISGLDALSEYLTGDLAAFRRFELAFTLNRLRGLSVVQNPEKN